MAENIDGIPNVDLSQIVNDLKVEEKPKETAKVKEEVKHDLAQFKTPEDLLKSYKELQAAYTKTSQAYKTLEGKTKELEEQISLSRTPTNYNTGNQEFDYENPSATINELVTLRLVTDVLEDERDKDVQAFDERYAFAQRVINQYPNLKESSRGVKKAFELGDKLRKDALKQSTSKALETVFGEPLNDEAIARLRSLVKGDSIVKETKNNSNAYMPDTTMSNRHSSNSDSRPDSAAEIKDSVKKGDVDGVLNEIFNTILGE